MVIIIIPQLNNAKDVKKWNVSEFVRMIMLLVLTCKLSILIEIPSKKSILIEMSTWKARIIILEITIFAQIIPTSDLYNSS